MIGHPLDGPFHPLHVAGPAVNGQARRRVRRSVRRTHSACTLRQSESRYFSVS